MILAEEIQNTADMRRLAVRPAARMSGGLMAPARSLAARQCATPFSHLDIAFIAAGCPR